MSKQCSHESGFQFLKIAECWLPSKIQISQTAKSAANEEKCGRQYEKFKM